MTKQPPLNLTGITSYTLDNGIISCDITNLGAAISSIRVKDRDGKTRDIVLGFDKTSDYLDNRYYLGVIVGRYANRIGGASFTLEGEKYTLSCNENGNTLHGGKNGFNSVIWETKNQNRDSLTLCYTDPEGNNGFPGTVTTEFSLRLEANSLIFEYDAVSDAPTHISLTNHSYFNLNGAGNGDIRNHLITIDSALYTEVDENYIPTGKIIDGTDSFYDLRKGAFVEHMFKDYPDMEYDINYVFTRTRKPKKICSAYSPQSGIMMELETTEPGLQWCGGSHLKEVKGKKGAIYNSHAGFCFEPQNFPDAPNQTHFPSSLIEAGEHYRQITALTFTAV